MGNRSRRRRSAGPADDEASLVDVFFSEVSREPEGADRKAKQVCREVFRVLAQAAPADPLLMGMQVMDVVPAPDSSRLAVRVWVAGDGDAVLEALRRWKGGLRGEIAQALQRKRTPEIVFELAPPSSATGEDEP